MKAFIYLDAIIGAPAYLAFTVFHPKESQYEFLLRRKQWDELHQGGYPEMSNTFQHIVYQYIFLQKEPTDDEIEFERFRLRPFDSVWRTGNFSWITAMSGSFMLMCARSRGPIGHLLLWYNVARYGSKIGGYKEKD